MFEEILKSEPKFRREQIYLAWFDARLKSFGDITTLSKNLREQIKNEPWITVKEKIIQTSKVDGTRKALLELHDGQTIETVLMLRPSKKDDGEAKLRYTICISSQVGCPMACSFCATGKLGFKRNLDYREIIDQFRFWQNILHAEGEGEIDNLVLMGQGEPLLNYDNVKLALQILIKQAKLGPRKITISSVGIPEKMQQMVEDKDFPPVRFALSLHSAITETRKQLIPSHRPDFFDWLKVWAKKYHIAFPSRTHFIGLEYTMMKGINDDTKHLKALIKIASNVGKVRVNLIPYNTACADGLSATEFDTMKMWQTKLNDCGIVCTIRRSQGQDIAAACGQLSNKYK
ncbi:MAG: 23S rRNA (adenine(2503)-C(2))-methyltransferase RlmN [Candidatus Magasanikbacteria bacterium]